MSQHDLILDNGSGAAFRADANNALAALGSSMKGPSAPPAPLAGMVWVDDDTPSATVWTVKQYDGADWIELGRLDITANIYIPSEGVIAWVDVVTAATVDLGAQASRSLRLTGTATISSFGTATSGVRKRLRIANGLTITHNATSLICPGAANLALGVGDIADVESLGSGNWVVTAVQPATTAGMRTLAGAAPLPQAAAGAGLWDKVDTSASVGNGYTLPAGGTYAYFMFRVNSSTGGVPGGANMAAGVAAGGTTILAGLASHFIYGFAWRIA
jgi:hypothetical protein